MMPTVPAGRCLSPANQQRNAIAVATSEIAPYASTLVEVIAGGAPSTTIAATSSISPPATSCQEVVATSGKSSLHFVARIAPSDESNNAMSEIATPSGSIRLAPSPTSRPTPTTPSTAPISMYAVDRCRSSGMASIESATGASAITEAATEVGNS